ncbi:MAG: hypothetical protein LQ350_001632 [Teloschistes chrysophthalmus]|nr:MAG: hypothetical protein LQ350_001632 [Niorma chrysophthalma]
MSASTGNGWAQLRQQARSLEAQTDTLFHTYSRFASASNIPPKPSEEETKTESQIQDLLEKRENLISQLTRLLDSESLLTASALKQNALTLHRNTLADHTLTLSRLRASILTARQRANLLSTVRSDISSYHRSQNPSNTEADYMLDERSRIDRSHGVADGVLSQAYAVNEQFAGQREMLGNVQRRIVGAAGKVPGINGLIGRIGAKRRRDGIILGSFVAFCMLMLLYFM